MKVLIRRHTPENPWHYRDAVELQNFYVQEELPRGAPGLALLSEFAPVVTLGRGHQRADFVMPDQEILARGVDVLEVDRGGRATYHGPGQWTLFLIDRMENLVGEKMGVKKMVSRLLDTAAGTCEAFQVPTLRREGAELGLWIPEEAAPLAGTPGKVVSVGIRVARGIVTHGVALNGYPTSESFYGIHPCGLAGARPGFALKEKSRFEDLGQEFLCQAASVFDLDFEFDGDFARQWGATL